MLNDREEPRGKRSEGLRIRRDSGVGVASSRSGSATALGKETSAADRKGYLDSQEWQLACRVAASKRLSKSDLLPKFLLYVCEQQLIGSAHEITEQRIGTQIFNRATDYNPGEDNIVRSYARLLRKRLDEYFEGEGRDEPMRIIIPRGGYVPIFHRRTDVQEAVSNISSSDFGNNSEQVVRSNEVVDVSETTAELGETITGARWQRPWLLLLTGLIAGALLASVGWFAVHEMLGKRARGPAHVIWTQLFQQDRNTLIVTSDSGLGVLQNITGRLVTLEDYANGSYLTDGKPVPGLGPGNLNDLRQQRYTSVVNLNITVMLTQLPEFIASRSQIRYARSITAEDLKGSNVILLGSIHTNPWVSLFDSNLNFKLKYMPEVDQSFLWNEHPLGKEQKKYLNGTAGMVNRTYGAIDYLPNLDGTGHVLILQGLNMAATQAAADILSNPEEMKPVLKQAGLPNGSLKSFELLVETSSIGATDPSARIIATRFYPL
jgi:hypothetical protein